MGDILSISGMLTVELTSANIPAALVVLADAGVEIYGTVFLSELSVRFRIRRMDHKKLTALCKRRGETLKILRKSGAYWTLRGLLGRPVLLIGILILIGFSIFLPSRVFFIRVEGNTSVPTRLILAAAEECGITFGAERREVRSERMKNELLEEVPELRWAGINTYGCVAVISVQERADVCENQADMFVSSIVACRDGVIVSTTVTEGNVLCRVGQAVKAGEVLISGYTDCGICIQATRSEGEIFAETTRQLTAVMPSEFALRGEVDRTKRNYSLIIGKNRINLWKDSGISDGTCGRMYEEYYITLPGGFQLPVCIAVEEYRFYALESSIPEQSEMQELLTEFSERYLIDQMVAGKILRRRQSMTPEGGVYRLTGEYVCLEMIGVTRREEIGEYNGKDN